MFVAYPHLKKQKKVQAVEGDEELNFIDLGALEVSCGQEAGNVCSQRVRTCGERTGPEGEITSRRDCDRQLE